ncbi:MAG: rhombosortase [Burkholderiaceae bacterium]
MTAQPRTPGGAWLALALLLALGALAGGLADPLRWCWQPSLAGAEPWRWWTAAWVHWSRLHLLANLAGVAAVALLGWRAGATRADALAWALAWPLTHLALALQPTLQRYGGLSGVLHAGVVIVAMRLAWGAPGPRRTIGAALLAGVALKLLLEEPWQGALRRSPGWDIAIAPAAHVAGAFAGALCAVAVATLERLLRKPRS